MIACESTSTYCELLCDTLKDSGIVMLAVVADARGDESAGRPPPGIMP